MSLAGQQPTELVPQLCPAQALCTQAGASLSHQAPPYYSQAREAVVSIYLKKQPHTVA